MTASRPGSFAPQPAAGVVLNQNGHVTGGFGNWHLTPYNVQGAAGPFDHWPKSWGFDHWWGVPIGCGRPGRLLPR